MRNVIIVVGICLLITGLAWAGEKATMPVARAPEVTEIKGIDAAQLAPAIFPQFIAKHETDNPTCEDWLAGLSGTRMRNLQSPYARDAGAWWGGVEVKADPAHPNQGTQIITANAGKWQPLPGLSKANFRIPEEYRKTAKLLITWTVRVEGRAYPVCDYNLTQNCFHAWPDLCHPWHGKAYLSFSKGNVSTRVYVDGSPVSELFTLEVPGPGQVTGNQPYDPTLTGSFLISPAELRLEEFPAVIRSIEIWWQNETAMHVTSPAHMRTMSITFMPLGESLAD